MLKLAHAEGWTFVDAGYLWPGCMQIKSMKHLIDWFQSIGAMPTMIKSFDDY